MLYCAISVALLMAIYHGMRFLASHCTGSGCDIFIPFSLGVPLMAIVCVALTGLTGVHNARAYPRWRIAIAVTALLGVLGPAAALAVRRDSPDVLVPVATVLILLCPACVWIYAIAEKRLV